MPAAAPTPAERSRRLLARLPFGHLVGQFAKFGVIGLVAYVVDVGVFNLLMYAGGEGPLNHKPLTAKTISVVVATLVAYFGNRQWTFRDHGRHAIWRESLLFFVFNAIALAITLVPLAVSRYAFGLTGPVADNISANVVGLALGTAFRFYAYRTWVFPVDAATGPLPPPTGRKSANVAG